MDCSLPGSSVHGILQTRIPEWVAMPSSRGSSQPTGRIRVSWVSCIGRRFYLPLAVSIYQQNHLGSPWPCVVTFKEDAAPFSTNLFVSIEKLWAGHHSSCLAMLAAAAAKSLQSFPQKAAHLLGQLNQPQGRDSYLASNPCPILTPDLKCIQLIFKISASSHLSSPNNIV